MVVNLYTLRLLPLGTYLKCNSWLSENEIFNLSRNLWGIPVPTAHPPIAADTITVECGSAWDSGGKLMKLVWEGPQFAVQVSVCLQNFLPADQRSCLPSHDTAHQHCAHTGIYHVERQRSLYREGWKEDEAPSKAIGVPHPRYCL